MTSYMRSFVLDMVIQDLRITHSLHGNLALEMLKFSPIFIGRNSPTSVSTLLNGSRQIGQVPILQCTPIYGRIRGVKVVERAVHLLTSSIRHNNQS